MAIYMQWQEFFVGAHVSRHETLFLSDVKSARLAAPERGAPKSPFDYP